MNDVQAAILLMVSLFLFFALMPPIQIYRREQALRELVNYARIPRQELQNPAFEIWDYFGFIEDRLLENARTVTRQGILRLQALSENGIISLSAKDRCMAELTDRLSHLDRLIKLRGELRESVAKSLPPIDPSLPAFDSEKAEAAYRQWLEFEDDYRAMRYYTKRVYPFIFPSLIWFKIF